MPNVIDEYEAYCSASVKSLLDQLVGSAGRRGERERILRQLKSELEAEAKLLSELVDVASSLDAVGSTGPSIRKEDAWACVAAPPEETRAWGRGQIIRKLGSHISSVNWDHIELYQHPDRWWPRLRVKMPQLDSLNRQSFEPIIECVEDVAQLGTLLEQNTQGAANETDPLMDVAHEVALPDEVDV